MQSRVKWIRACGVGWRGPTRLLVHI